MCISGIYSAPWQRLLKVEQPMEWDLTKVAEVVWESLTECNFVHHKSYMTLPSFKPRPEAVAWAMTRLIRRSLVLWIWCTVLLNYHICYFLFPNSSVNYDRQKRNNDVTKNFISETQSFKSEVVYHIDNLIRCITFEVLYSSVERIQLLLAQNYTIFQRNYYLKIFQKFCW